MYENDIFHQIGLLGVLFIVTTSYYVKIFRGIAFYILLAIVSTVVVLFPIDDQVAIVILLEFLTKDPQKVSEIPFNLLFLSRSCLKNTFHSIFSAMHDNFVYRIDRNDRGDRYLANESA